jgi:hypothetical protein
MLDAYHILKNIKKRLKDKNLLHYFKRLMVFSSESSFDKTVDTIMAYED